MLGMHSPAEFHVQSSLLPAVSRTRLRTCGTHPESHLLKATPRGPGLAGRAEVKTIQLLSASLSFMKENVMLLRKKRKQALKYLL